MALTGRVEAMQTFESNISKLRTYPKKYLYKAYKEIRTRGILAALLVQKELEMMQMSINNTLDE